LDEKILLRDLLKSRLYCSTNNYLLEVSSYSDENDVVNLHLKVELQGFAVNIKVPVA
jgi:hypothetical protein